MTGEPKDTEKLKQVVALLAGANCGKCGFENCGEFAVALVEGKTSPVICRKSLDNLEEICRVLGIEVPERPVAPPGGHHRRPSDVNGHHHHHDKEHHGHGHHDHSRGHGKGDHHHSGGQHSR